MNNDVEILKELAYEIEEISQKDNQEKKRELWRKHNSLKTTRPPVIINGGRAFKREIITEDKLECNDPFYRNYEYQFRQKIFKADLGDDHIVEPWINLKASFKKTGWGPEIRHIGTSEGGTAYKFDPVIKEKEDIEKLEVPHHIIDEEDTKYKVNKLKDAIGGILEINVDRSPWYQSFKGDISTDIVQLLGLNELMMYMYDRPKWLKKILKFMRDGILTVHEEAEEADDWNLGNQGNQAEPYDEELPDPQVNKNVGRNKLWGFFASQEYAQVSPEKFYEFMLQYQIPIMKKFGLTAYGCCEDLTRKIDYLKQIPNLRRIAVTPWADVAKCAEQIEDNYVFSWRPHPANMVCGKWDPAQIKKIVREALEASAGCIVDITLKDIQTVQNEPERLSEWVKIVKDMAAKYA